MPDCEYAVRIAPAASEKLLAHVRFLAQVSVTAAERLYDELYEAVYSLEYNPERYPRYFQQTEIDAVLRYILCAKRYRIVFEVIGGTVYIYDIQDCRQDTDKNLV